MYIQHTYIGNNVKTKHNNHRLKGDYDMSRKLEKATSEKDKKKLRYTKVKCTTAIEDIGDINALTSTQRFTEFKDATPTPKRKRSQGSSPISGECTKPSKVLNMSKSPEEGHSENNITPAQPDIDEEDNELTLSQELAKLERILSRKQNASLEGIKNAIKLLLENEKLIKKQQDTIDELKKENSELNVKCNKLEKNQSQLKKRVSDIENELYSSNVIIHGISESENEEGPERYRLVTKLLATTIYASTYEEQIAIARKIPIKITYSVLRYKSQRGRPIVVQFVYYEDCENLLANKNYLPRGVYADRQYSQDTVNK